MIVLINFHFLHLQKLCLYFIYFVLCICQRTALLYAFEVHFIEENQSPDWLRRYLPLHTEYIWNLLTMVATFPLFLSCWTAKECRTFSIGVPLTMTTRSFSLEMGREIKKEREDLRGVFMKTAEQNFFYYFFFRGKL